MAKPYDIGPDVHLEAQVAAHAAEMYPILRNPVLYRFTDGAPPTDEEALRERFRKLESRCSPDGSEKWLNWVLRRQDGVAVGYVQATVHQDRLAEIAFVLGREFWGNGYAFAGTRLMLADLALNHGATRFKASVDPRNTRSVALMARLGFSARPERSEGGDLLYEASSPVSASQASTSLRS